jgi:SAM-dependent methyltransferase
MTQPSLQDFAHGGAFRQPSVIAAYKYRPAYPAETFEFLETLLAPGAPRRVLDMGCGTGLITLPLAVRVDSVDAVDISAGMIAEGKAAPGGDRANIAWIVSPAETAPLSPPYALATAGDSLGWMDWAIVLPRLADALAPGAMLAILNCRPLAPPWQEELLKLIPRYSTNQNFKAVNVPAELVARGVFDLKGRHTTGSATSTQSIDDYIESFHGRAGFAREWMTPESAAAFDDALRALIRNTGADEVRIERVADIAWGQPKRI